MGLMSLTAVELGKKIRSGEVKVIDAVNEALARIEAFDQDLNCYVTVDAEGARKRAEEVQKLIDEGSLTGPLAGVPVAIKDN
ncbi:MAG: amidase family protein, partial [Lachnospiraceae bacterium]|nr:amidase family protein [Lachnospiraceae bacterium]